MDNNTVARNNVVPLLAILGVGIAVRLWQINWGLPELYEEATPMRIAWRFWNWGKPGLDFNPHFFNYPALTFYIHFAAQSVQYWIGHFFGSYNDLQSFSASLVPLAVPARLINVVFDAGTIIVVYTIAKEIADRRTALIASAFIAVNPAHIIHAHLIEVDPALTFFTALSVLYILRIYSRPRMRWYILVGFSIALATSSKYTGALLLFMLIGAHILRHSSLTDIFKSWNDRSLIWSVVIAIGGFFLLNPYVLLDFQKFREDFSYEQFHVSYGHLGVVSSESTLGYYLTEVMASDFGWLFCLILIITAGYCILRPRKEYLLLLFYAVLYLAVISMWEMRAERYILPVFPIISIICSIGIVRSYDWFSRYLAGRNLKLLQPAGLQKYVLVFAFIALTVQPAMKSGEYLRSLGLPDTRSITKSWIKKNMSPGSVIATGPYGIDFPDTSYRIFLIPFRAVESERVVSFYDSRWYEDFDILIASSYDYDRYLQEPEKYAAFLPYYDSLKTKWSLMFEVKPSEYQNGPAFWLYRFPDSSRRRSFDLSMFQRLYAAPESSGISSFLKLLNAVEMHKQQFEKSEQILKEILSVEVQNNPFRNFLGQSLYSQGKYEEAAEQLEHSIHADTNQARAFSLLGSTFMRMNRTAEGETMLLKAVSLDPGFELPYGELIELYVGRRDKFKLLDILHRYYAILPKGTEKAEQISTLIEQVGLIEE